MHDHDRWFRSFDTRSFLIFPFWAELSKLNTQWHYGCITSIGRPHHMIGYSVLLLLVHSCVMLITSVLLCHRFWYWQSSQSAKRPGQYPFSEQAILMLQTKQRSYVYQHFWHLRRVFSCSWLAHQELTVSLLCLVSFVREVESRFFFLSFVRLFSFVHCSYSLCRPDRHTTLFSCQFVVFFVVFLTLPACFLSVMHQRKEPERMEMPSKLSCMLVCIFNTCGSMHFCLKFRFDTDMLHAPCLTHLFGIYCGFCLICCELWRTLWDQGVTISAYSAHNTSILIVFLLIFRRIHLSFLGLFSVVCSNAYFP